MSKSKETPQIMKTLVGLVLGFVLLLATAAASFYAGMLYAGAAGPTIVEVEVTREVPVEIVREQGSAPRSDAPVDGGAALGEEIQVTPVPAEAAGAEADAGEGIESSEGNTTDPAEQRESDEEPVRQGPPAENLTADDLDLLFEVWDIIDDDFDGDLPDVESLNYALIGAALETLDDDYTTFVPPDVAARFREDMDGSFEGIGAFVRENDDGFIEIVRPMDGRPADLAGIEAGDLIIEVDGENILGQSLDEVISKVRGPRDTEVILGIARENVEDLIQITIVRARIEIPTVEYELFENGIGYIQLSTFNAIASDRLTEATADLLDQGAEGLILDLRDNPGGFLDTAIEVADLYLPESVVLFERNANGLDQTFRADDGEIGEDIPLVVLVNAGSASASELVAGALRDNGRAVLIGDVTFGKGSVQQLRNLSDGSELRVTIARWFTPGNVNISAAGLTPDIEVELPTDVNLGSEEDPQLQRAVDYLLDGE